MQLPENCYAAESDGKCYQCQGGHGVSGGLCKPCSAGPNCAQCDGSAQDQCTACKEGPFALVDGRCVPVSRVPDYSRCTCAFTCTGWHMFCCIPTTWHTNRGTPAADVPPPELPCNTVRGQPLHTVSSGPKGLRVLHRRLLHHAKWHVLKGAPLPSAKAGGLCA